MTFNCTNKGRFSVYHNGSFAEFVNGEFKTDNVTWLDVLKNVQGVQVVDGGEIEQNNLPSPPPFEEETVSVKKKPGRPKKDNK